MQINKNWRRAQLLFPSTFINYWCPNVEMNLPSECKKTLILIVLFLLETDFPKPSKLARVEQEEEILKIGIFLYFVSLFVGVAL